MTNAKGSSNDGIRLDWVRLYKPSVWCPGFSRSGPPEGGTPNELPPTVTFMVAMHGIKVVGAFHEPRGSGTGVSPVCRSHESHGRDARATISAQRFMVPKHFNMELGALHARS